VQADFHTICTNCAREIDQVIGRPAAPISEEDLAAKVLFNDPHFVVADL
jgi:hypothetical protein